MHTAYKIICSSRIATVGYLAIDSGLETAEIFLRVRILV